MYDSILGGGRRERDDWGYLFLLSGYAVVLSSWSEFAQLETIAKNFVFVFYDVLHNTAVDCHCVK